MTRYLPIAAALLIASPATHAERANLPPLVAQGDKKAEPKLEGLKLPKLEDEDKKDKAKEDKDKKKDEDKKEEKKDAPPGKWNLPRRLVQVDLASARATALARQPSITAARQSLEAAIERQAALAALRVPTFLRRDLPTRREQACRGVDAARAAVSVAEFNAVYAAQFTYLSRLFAREQERVVDNAIKNLDNLRESVEKAVEEGSRDDLSKRDVLTLEAYLHLAKGKREEAVKGGDRALAALREAMALCPTFEMTTKDVRLLDLEKDITRQAVIDLALSRRAELIMAGIGIEVVGLEVTAQASRRCLPTLETFASGSDVHALPLPAGNYDFDYKPGALPPEMPGKINGMRDSRVRQAEMYLGRAGTVLEKARALIALEAEQAFYRYEEARDKLRSYEQAHAKAKAVFGDLLEDFSPADKRVKLETLLSSALFATQMRVQANEARYQYLVSLALIERVTAGGIASGLEAAPMTKESD